MKGFQLYVKAFIFLLCIQVLGFSDKGDIFFSVKGVTSILLEDTFSAGGDLGIEFGFNERTDFSINGSFLYGPETDEFDGFILTDLAFSSFFTPYFGDIRPRIGGKVGICDFRQNEADEIMPLIGVPIQALITLNPSLMLLGEVSPALAFGEKSFFDVSLRAGIKFRLSK